MQWTAGAKKIVAVTMALLFTVSFAAGTVNAAGAGIDNGTLGTPGQNMIKTISSDYMHTLFLEPDGTVASWGDNAYGDVGDGTTTQQDFPVRVQGLTGVVQVAAGHYFSLALKSDGTVWAWGLNSYGQLGDGTRTNRALPVQVQNLTGVVAIAAGYDHALALTSDGHVWAWGNNSWGQLSSSAPSTGSTVPVQVSGLSNVVAIAADYELSVALRSDGTVWWWGHFGIGGQTSTPTMISTISNVRAIAAGFGGKEIAALTSDGSVWEIGYNGSPQEVTGLPPIKAISISPDPGSSWHAIALARDGSVWTWGWDDHGQLGNGVFDPTLNYSPAKVMSGAVAIAAGEGTSFAVDASGRVWAWGWNYLGALGTGAEGTIQSVAGKATPTIVGKAGLPAFYQVSGSSLGPEWASAVYASNGSANWSAPTGNYITKVYVNVELGANSGASASLSYYANGSWTQAYSYNVVGGKDMRWLTLPYGVTALQFTVTYGWIYASSPAEATGGLWLVDPAVTPQITSYTVTPGPWAQVGRGRVTLSWTAVPAADGYYVDVFDGNQYRRFDAGNAASWDSDVALIFPPESQLSGYATNSQSGDLFYHNQGGERLRDDPSGLYRVTVGSTYDGAHNYWIRVAAYRSAGGPSAYTNDSSAITPTLPNRTDIAPPQVVSVAINGGDMKTQNPQVTVSVTAVDPAVSNWTSDPSDDASGIVGIRFSNDGQIWSSWAAFPATGPSAPGQQVSDVFNWTLSAGSGGKTVYVEVEDQAGNVSSPAVATIELVESQPPSAQLVLNGGNRVTTSTQVQAMVPVTGGSGDPSTWKMRFSDGGASWGAWQAYSGIATVSLSPTAGTHVVYVNVKDQSGLVAQAAATITYQPAGQPLVGSGSISAPAFTRTPTITVTVTPPSGAVQVRLGFDGATWGDWQTIGSSAKQFQVTLPGGDGQKAVYVQFADANGNLSEITSAPVTLDMTPPALSASWAGNATVTRGGSATLVIVASDNISDDSALQVQVLVNGSVKVGWTAYQPSITLTGFSAGVNTVLVEVRDQAGNVSKKALTIYN